MNVTTKKKDFRKLELVISQESELTSKEISTEAHVATINKEKIYSI